MAAVPGASRIHANQSGLRCALVFLAMSIATGAGASGAESPVFLVGDRVRIEAQIVGEHLHERYLARTEGGEWSEVAADHGPDGCVTLTGEDGARIAVRPARVAVEGGALVEEMQAGDARIMRTLRVMSDGPWIHVTTHVESATAGRLHTFVDRFVFARAADWSYAPSVGGFVPDAQYKSPLVLVQSGALALGVVPDLTTLDRAALQRCNHALELDARESPHLAVGFMPARMAYHSVFAPDPQRAWTADGAVENSYYLLVTASAQPAEAYREAVRFLWRTFGEPTQRIAAAQQQGTATEPKLYDWIGGKGSVAQQVETDRSFPSLALWDEWRPVVWQEQTRQNWLELPLPDGAKGGGVWTHRWGPGPSIYLSAWFNTLRTSLGLALYARRVGDDDLLRRAGATVEVALRAPGRDGAFKCIAAWDAKESRVVWAAGDGSGDSTESGFLGYDMSWTAYWLLRWRAAGLPEGERILARCRTLAEFFVARQESDGMLPTRFAEDGSVQEDRSREVKAETGPVALFLLELHAQDPDSRWLDAGLKALRFLDADVVPRRQWYDYETFWSCSPRQPQFDDRTKQWPANDLALGQAVAAYLAAFRATNDQSYLERGERLLDYLLLYQQCWTNPVLEGITGPAMLLGGFTTQNSDAEWSDARQSQFGNVLLDYYRATGRAEYLERGVAALRAQFPISPAENWAHSGYGPKSGISSFHWGTGSGMAGIEIEEDFLRDGVVDVAAGVGVGVNGLNVTTCEITGDAIRLEIDSPFTWSRSPVVIFHHADPHRAYRLSVNGVDLGPRRGDELARGLEISLNFEKTMSKYFTAIRWLLNALGPVLAAGVAHGAGTTAPPPLRISENHRYLIDAQDRPFLLQGDAAWSLIANTTKEEAIHYLDNRRAKGFNGSW